MSNTYKGKKRFVNRGIYNFGDDDGGTLLVNLKQYDSDTHRKMLVLSPIMSHDKKTDKTEIKVDVTFIDMVNADIKSIFDEGGFEFVSRMPKIEYKRYISLYGTQGGK